MPTPVRDDPVLQSTRREAMWVLAIWSAALIYTVGVCWTLGYGRSPESLRFVCGFPDWVFWGIVVPWNVCTALTAWFALRFMSDATLGDDEPDGEPLPGVEARDDRFAAYQERHHA